MKITEYGARYIDFIHCDNYNEHEIDRDTYTNSELNYERTVYRQVEEKDDELL